VTDPDTKRKTQAYSPSWQIPIWKKPFQNGRVFLCLNLIMINFIYLTICLSNCWLIFLFCGIRVGYWRVKSLQSWQYYFF